MLEPTQDYTQPEPGDGAENDTLLSRLFGVRRGDGVTVESGPVPESRTVSFDRGSRDHVSRERATLDRSMGGDRGPDQLREEIGERVSTGFRDMSRLLVAIKESLQDRDGQVRQTLKALPDYLQQVPRIQRAQVDCMAQISRQLEHMGTGTRDVLARLDNVPDLLRSLVLHQEEQAKFLGDLQAKTADALEVQSGAIREGLDTSRKQAEHQLQMIRSVAATQEDVFATFQNTQNRALNVFHRAQQQSNAQHRETQTVLSKQVETLVEKVHSAQTRVFWLSIGFVGLAIAGIVAMLLLG